MVDTQGNILTVKVHAANIHDTIAGGPVFEAACKKYTTIKGGSADAGYRNTMVKYVKEKLDKIINISERISSGWELQPVRWVVERTLSWFNGQRRLAKDYEISISSAENYIMIAHSRVLLTRLALS